MKRKIFSVLAGLGFLVIFVGMPAYSVVHAVEGGSTHTQTTTTKPNLNIAFHLDNPLKGADSVDSFFQKVLRMIVYLLTPIIVIMFIYSGLRFVMAQGNEEQLATAKKALLYAIIGAAIIIGAEALSRAIGETIRQL